MQTPKKNKAAAFRVPFNGGANNGSSDGSVFIVLGVYYTAAQSIAEASNAVDQFNVVSVSDLGAESTDGFFQGAWIIKYDIRVQCFGNTVMAHDVLRCVDQCIKYCHLCV